MTIRADGRASSMLVARVDEALSRVGRIACMPLRYAAEHTMVLQLGPAYLDQAGPMHQR